MRPAFAIGYVVGVALVAALRRHPLPRPFTRVWDAPDERGAHVTWLGISAEIYQRKEVI